MGPVRISTGQCIRSVYQDGVSGRCIRSVYWSVYGDDGTGMTVRG